MNSINWVNNKLNLNWTRHSSSESECILHNTCLHNTSSLIEKGRRQIFLTVRKSTSIHVLQKIMQKISACILCSFQISFFNAICWCSSIWWCKQNRHSKSFIQCHLQHCRWNVLPLGSYNDYSLAFPLTATSFTLNRTFVAINFAPIVTWRSVNCNSLKQLSTCPPPLSRVPTAL